MNEDSRLEPVSAQPMPSHSATPVMVAPRTSGMAITSLILGCVSFMCWIFTGLPAVILGILALRSINRSNGGLKGDGLAIGGIVTGGISTFLIMPIMVALLLPAVQAAREAARRNAAMNNLKQISFALQGFAADHRGQFPAAKGEDGSPLSWRVHLLPQLGEQTLYKQFHLDEPWDSEHNKALIAQIPAAYMVPGSDFAEGETSYLAVTGPGTAFGDGTTGPGMEDFIDGAAETIVVVEADQGVIWTKPEDYQFDPSDPKNGLGGKRRFGFLALMADGYVTFVRDDDPPNAVAAMMTRSGRESIAIPADNQSSPD
jgi:type II secretory pathway pseudopilin PulG